jgi:hypothetical protein
MSPSVRKIAATSVILVEAIPGACRTLSNSELMAIVFLMNLMATSEARSMQNDQRSEEEA